MAYHARAYYLREHNDNPLILSEPENVDNLVDQLLAIPGSDNMAVLYIQERPRGPHNLPDHELFLALNRGRSVGALKFGDKNGNWATRGPANDQPPGEYVFMGTESEFPAQVDISLDLLRTAVKEFLASGGQRPAGVDWQDDDTV
jgi:hypothetical protein